MQVEELNILVVVNTEIEAFNLVIYSRTHWSEVHF